MKILPRYTKSRKKRQLQEREREARVITEHSSQESLQCSDENEDVKNTTDDFYKNFKELIEGYENDEGEFIDMSQPRDASYATKMEYNDDTDKIKIVDTERLGKDVHLTSAATSYRSMPTEVRGITLRQLRAIIPLIKRRCEEENWTRSVYFKDGKETKKKEKVTLENATLYDINKYVIKPFTESSQKSFVETLPSTKGTQPPRWFVSHYWGETFVHTMACLEQMVKDFERNLNEKEDRKGGGMTEDTPVWICAFANNQHNLESDIADDPAKTSFAKAMKIAKFRVISILDVKNQVYTRLWCMYELYLTLLLSREQGIDGVLAIYTYYEHTSRNYRGVNLKRTAVGLVEGGATSDGDYYDMRQKFFPRERLLPFLTVSIQDAVASEDKDRKNIMNSLHKKYDALNDAIRGAVFSSQATLNLIYKTGKTNWDSALSALKKSSGKVFRFYESEMLQLPKEAMAQVFHHLPSGLESLTIIDCPHGRVAMDALLDWLENESTNLKGFFLSGTFIGEKVGGEKYGERLAKFLARNDCKIESIFLVRNNLIGSRNFDTWIECLQKNQSLRCISLSATELTKKQEKALLKAAKSTAKTQQGETKTVDNEVRVVEEFVLEEGVDNEINMIEKVSLEESNAPGEKPNSNWLCGVVSCF